jgi:murein DD-endopeptidase MepM/ murein hydrolase activator NlpD
VRLAPQSCPERRAGGINGILRRERTAERPFISPHSVTPRYTVTPAIRRLWIASLLALLVLVCTSASPLGAETSVAVITDPDGVNLRGGPGTAFPSLAVIPKGGEASVLGPKVNERWLPVSYQGQIGFIFDEFVEVRTATAPAAAATQPSPSASPSPSPSAASAGQALPQEMRVNSSDGLNLRAGPNTDQRVVMVIPNNSTVKVIGRSPDGRWINVSFNGQSGWVDAQFLERLDQRPNASPSPSPSPPANPGAAAGTARFIWPVAGRSITTPFSGGHPGIDVDQYPSGGNPVVAVAAGKVTFAGGNPCCSYGLYITIEHDDGAETLYAHLGSVDVRDGQTVTQGQTIGQSGNTGRSTGAHLHFEMHMGGSPIDPMGLLAR